MVFAKKAYFDGKVILQAVYNDLGQYCRERQYGDAIEKIFREQSIVFVREYPIPLEADGRQVSNRVDFMVEQQVLVDLKAKQFITREDYYQMQRYLHAANYKLGLLVNFQRRYASIKRIIRIDKYL